VLREIARQAAERFGDTAAYVAPNGWELSYADLDRLSDELAAGLHARGVGAGDVVALVLPQAPEYPIAYLACAKLGAVTAGVNTRLSDPERDAVLFVANPCVVLTTNEFAPAAFDTIDVRLASTSDGAFADVRINGGSPPQLPDDPDRPVALVFTSGTTGLPKGAVFASRQLEAITAIETGGRWGGGGRTIAATSLAHLGFMTKFGSNLRSGGTSWIMARWDADAALQVIEDHAITNVGGIPTQVALMLRSPFLEETNTSSLQVVVMGGGPATPALIREARERFKVPVLVRYSCTEAGIGVGTDFDSPDEDAEESVGRPRAGVDLTIRDSSDTVLPAGEVGEICLRSPASMSEYYRDPEATAAVFTADRSVRTGDLGWIDDAGRLHLVGRSKEMYVRGGYNVYPVEVEGVLSLHPDVGAVAIAPRPDPIMGEIGVAVVVPASNLVTPTLDALRDFGRSRLASYKLPEAIKLVHALPLTAMEKIDRAALASLVQ
jgi:acyl-CoA synthetase (AMP-forming)/AMP-acid ligase II